MNRKQCQAEERRIVVSLMMLVGGMMGAYTYVIRGGVFCNAQTGNVLLMGIELGKGDWAKGLYYLIPFIAYLAGTYVSEVLRSPGRKYYSMKWNTCFTGCEILCLLGIGCLPLSLPDQIVQVAINFLASIQYNSFRKAEGIPMATTFCTNHIRQAGIFLADYRKTHNPESKRRITVHLTMLGCFLLGVVLVTALSPLLGGKTIWIALLPLAVAFLFLLYEDVCQLDLERHFIIGNMYNRLHLYAMESILSTAAPVHPGTKIRDTSSSGSIQGLSQ